MTAAHDIPHPEVPQPEVPRPEALPPEAVRAPRGVLARLGLIGLACLLAWLWLPPGPAPWLVFFGDIPFLVLVLMDGGRHWKRWALLYGFLYILAAAHWLAYITPAHPFAAAVVVAPVYVLFGGVVRWIAARRIPFAFGVGVAAVLEEMLRTIWVGGFPWPQRGLAFATDADLDLGMTSLLPLAAWAGAWLFGFAAAFVGATTIRTAGGLAAARGSLRAVPVACLLGIFLMQFTLEDRPTWEDRTARHLVVVQGAIDQSLKQGSGDAAQRMFDEHVRLSAVALRRLGRARVLGVLWPETMIPWPFVDPDIAHRFPEAWEDEVGVVRRLHDDAPLGRGVPWFLGAIHHFRRGDERQVELWDYGDHDSLAWVDVSQAPPSGTPIPAPPPVGQPAPWMKGRHDKVHLVPGGEYTPGGTWLPALEWFRRQISRFPALDPGPLEQDPWPIPTGEGEETVAIGSIVCYDVAFPRACRAWRRQGAAVLLNPGNYGWFGPTAFRSQLAAHARLRAAELAVTVVVAGNTGPSAFYDPMGRPYGTFVEDGATEGVPAGGLETTYLPGFAHAPLRTASETTLYTRLGDLPWYLLAALLALAGLVRGRRSGGDVADPA